MHLYLFYGCLFLLHPWIKIQTVTFTFLNISLFSPSPPNPFPTWQQAMCGWIFLFPLLLSFLLHTDYLSLTLPGLVLEERIEKRKKKVVTWIVFFGFHQCVFRDLHLHWELLSWDQMYLLLADSWEELSSSQVGFRDPWALLRPSQGICKVKTIFIMILRFTFSFSFSHNCTVENCTEAI